MEKKQWFLMIVVIITGILLYIKSQSDQRDRELVKEVQQLYTKSESQLKNIEELKLSSAVELASASVPEMRAAISELETRLIIWKESTEIVLNQPTKHLTKEARAKFVEVKEHGTDLSKQYTTVVEEIEAIVTMVEKSSSESESEE